MHFQKYTNFYITIKEGAPEHNRKQTFSQWDNSVMINEILKFFKFQVAVYIRISGAMHRF